MLARSRDSRKSARRWMRRDAQVILEAFEQPIRCTVHDLSDGGARLSFAGPLADLPRAFTLALFKDNVQRDCEMVWLNGRFVGVRFISQWFVTKSSERVAASKDPRPVSRERSSLA